jgi:hypothetical protein
VDVKKGLLAIAAISGLAMTVGSVGSASAVEFITIGTGGVTGVYYPIGGSICRLVNKGKKEHGVRCSVESTSGSVYNINTIRAGELDMGVAQSDWQYHAYKGTSKFKGAGPFKALRAVFSVHAERINIGSPGSGTETTWNIMWNAMGYKNSDLKLVAQMKLAETPGALCDNKIDALFFLVGHPNGLSKEATTRCDSILVVADGPAIVKLVRENTFYRYAKIPAGMYRGNPEYVKTFGVGAIVISSTRTPARTVYQVVKAVFENFNQFKRLHPVFGVLKKSEMIKDVLSAPLHDGAKKYYKEKGWM